MIPLRSTERIFSTAVVTASLIAVNILIFLYQLTLGPADQSFVMQWGIVPDQMRGTELLTLVTSMFLHGGWFHVLGNMLFLWVFGRNVEDLIGGPRFFAFYILGGIAAGVVQVIANPYSRTPTIGASGAIAGVMGAYLKKIPRSRIVTLIFIFFFVTTVEIPAAVILIYWFALNFLNGIWSLGATNYTAGGVAWFAHIGGFLVGMLLIRFFPARKRWRAWYEED